MLVTDLTAAQVLEHYRGKKVFITGHTGFKGSWLSLLLSRAGAILKGYALAPETNSLYGKVEPHLTIDSVLADLREPHRLNEAIHTFRPDYLFHLAAQPLVRYSYLHPVETFDVNVMGTVHVLEALRTLPGSCAAVLVTTDKVYENNETGIPFGEGDPLGGHDPYSSSKAAAEIVVQSYAKSFFPLHEFTAHQKSVATARAGNVIGGGDYAPDRIIPDLVRAVNAGKPLQLRNPQAVRPWQHVLDPLSGYLRLALMMHFDPHKYAGSYNFGPQPEDQLMVKEIVELALAVAGKGSYVTPALTRQPHEAGNLVLDITKATRHLHWQPRWNARKVVEHTMNWYNEAQNGNEFELCVRDVNEFMK